MLTVDFGSPKFFEVRLEDSEYDIDCPKCKKGVFSRRDKEVTSLPEFKCPNCNSSVSHVQIYGRIGPSGFADMQGDFRGSYLICDQDCGWEANNDSKGERITHIECGAEIGEKFIKSKAIDDYDIEENDPAKESFIQRLLGAFHKFLVR